MFRMCSEPTIPRTGAHFQIGCLPIRKGQPLKLFHQCNTIKSTNMQGMVLHNTATRHLTVGVAQAVGEA